MDQAQKLRTKVHENKLSALIDDIKNIKDITEIYGNLLSETKSKCQVLCFISAKGGIGKTLAVYLFAELLKKNNKRCAIVDLNKRYSDILYYYPDKNLTKVKKSNLVENSCFTDTFSDGGRQCIFHIDNEIRNLEYQLFKIVLYQARLSQFDFVLIDTTVGDAELIDNIYPIVENLYCIITPDTATLLNTVELFGNLTRVSDSEKYRINFICNMLDTQRSDNDKTAEFINGFSGSEKIEIKNVIRLPYSQELKNIIGPVGVTADIFGSAPVKTLEYFISSNILNLNVSSATSSSLFGRISALLKPKNAFK